MRSLKECYEITKRFHFYWGDEHHTQYMCHAAMDAHQYGLLTRAESDAVQKDAQSLVESINSRASSLAFALYGADALPANVKAFWDKYIDNLENQDE